MVSYSLLPEHEFNYNLELFGVCSLQCNNFYGYVTVYIVYLVYLKCILA
jgi:hypothetical protein